MPRHAVAIALPPDELAAVGAPLMEAGYEALPVRSPDELERILELRRDVGLAILDSENDFDGSLEMYSLLHDGGRKIPALIAIAPRALDRMRLAGHTRANDEYFSRPYSPESLRWRVEAMLIRTEVLPAYNSGPILETETRIASSRDSRRGQVVVVFNPKGGVGKTTIAVNLAAALQVRRGRRVMLVDSDTVTGHIASTLGLEQVRTVTEAWNDVNGPGAMQTLSEIASRHDNGVAVLVMAGSPLHTEVLDPARVAQAINAARHTYDWVIVDMHPDYGPLNQAIFNRADTIVVPVTPDLPTIRAAVQFRRVADEFGIADRLSLVINRSNSGVSVADVERTVGLTAICRIRSAGLTFVRASNDGQSAVERFPHSKVVGDVIRLADRLIAGGAPDRVRAPLTLRGRLRAVFDIFTPRPVAVPIAPAEPAAAGTSEAAAVEREPVGAVVGR